MRKLFIISLVAILFMNCEDKVIKYKTEPIVNIDIVKNSYYSNGMMEFISEPNISIEGFAVDIDAVDDLSLYINMENIDLDIDLQNVSIYQFSNKSIIPCEGNELEVKLITDFGELNSTVSIPNSIIPFNIVYPDSIECGEQFIISWDEAEADFYKLKFEYMYNLHLSEDDTITVNNSITINENKFNYDGNLFIRIRAAKGTINNSVAPNMTGDGKGYVNCYSEEVIIPIVVGDVHRYTDWPDTSINIWTGI